MTPPDAQALPRAFFLPAHQGQRLCLFHAPCEAGAGPRAGERSRVLYLHPFAEEMHAARRVVAQQCRALAAQGHAVLQIDLLGCGDSSGDFGDATWADWVQDALLGLHWLHQHTAPAPTWLWGLRAGALLACSTATAWQARHPTPPPLHLLLWQAPASGQQQLQQFLRLHTAAQWLGRAAQGEPPAQRLAAGQHAHVSGYRLSPPLAQALSQATLDLPPGPGRLEMIDLHTGPPGALPPWLERQHARWTAAGRQVRHQVATSPSFWQNVVASRLTDELDRATREALA